MTASIVQAPMSQPYRAMLSARSDAGPFENRRASEPARTSYLQSRIFLSLVRNMGFAVRPGPSNSIRFPKWGPVDERSDARHAGPAAGGLVVA